MAATIFFKFLLFSLRVFLKRLKYLRPFHRKGNSYAPTSQLQKYPSFNSKRNLDKLSDQTLVCDVEGALLKSSSPFPYFMLVAFEGGGLLRAFVLLLLYPLVCCLSREMALKVMVMVSFFGIREEGFRVGRAVLAKYFLEDVSMEVYEVLKRGGRRVCVSEMPRVMVEGFLKEYMGVEAVLGRELKVVSGYYVGLMEEKEKMVFELEEEKMVGGVVGIGSFNSCLDQHFFSLCKEIYLVTEADKRNSHILPRDKYPKPLIFHDGRLAFRPTPLATLAMFMWVPFGFLLAIFRALVALSLPYKMALPILFMTGMRLRLKTPISSPSTPNKRDPKGILYVCNHRTLLDPLYLSTALNKPITAVTYSLSRLSELLAPIKTVRLTRNREEDRKRMERLLSRGDLVVCPEGTTCREPFLLRFSPLFAELTDEIVPVAMNAHVSMFYGTTAGGLKCLDPLFFLMNPFPGYNVEVLGKVAKGPTSHGVGISSIDVANFVQGELGKALGFCCTTLTRKDKYLMLAGNEGVVPNSSDRQCKNS
ncbi:probable glycerol-3-phosphate acyltransferase 3 [Magnolia sinica]|uniref:probable glycerol-3-phosphate acyltransferase 3 n=1 Tax=Magnolia sinica TaxID=86752 RepID=UPI002657DD5D|nr:probable glycerol-3-phosphate acyltransferase 3 [Magnolia sinica]